MSKREDLLKRIKNMDLEELTSYRVAAAGATRIIDILGVGTILGLLVFTIPLVYIPGGIALYIMANMGSSLDEAIDYIEERIAILSKDQINS